MSGIEPTLAVSKTAFARLPEFINSKKFLSLKLLMQLSNIKKRQLGLIVKESDILARLEKSIEIKAPPEKVWEMLAFDRYLEWDEGTQKNAKSEEYTSEVHTPEDKYRVGATAHMTLNKGDLYLEITESLENEKMTYRLEGTFDGIVTYSLEPVEKGTKLTYAADAKFRSTLMNILYKLFQRVAKKELERSLEKLKSILDK